MTESEASLEEKLIEALRHIEYRRAKIDSEQKMMDNLKEQLEYHNDTKYSENEFRQIKAYLKVNSIFEAANRLRDKADITADDGSIKYVSFFNQKDWCKNLYQVTNQITIEGKYTNRYDVTLLINGLPLVQIELKKRGMELKEAFNQIKRYEKHSYSEGFGLFRYVQLFVISNGENTKYFANDPHLDFSFTSFWTDDKNNKINQLMDFTTAFLEPCHISKMIAKYMVLNSQQKLMVLRPYQFYAVEAIENTIKNSTQNAYVWHTTGSGKTLTSFKASQLIKNMPEIDKVLFVVDRNDLDVNTQKEFNFFSEGSVDRSKNTRNLTKKLASFKPEDKLVLTTIQKLDRALKGKLSTEIEHLIDKKVIFIFDECHRSQFGDIHKRILKFFKNCQMIGFTGTPIFKQNSVNKKLNNTTERLFGNILHKYLINDAIADNNVIPFSVDYISTIKQKDRIDDKKVFSIDKEEAYDNASRIKLIVEHIIEIHDIKTKDKSFNSLLATSSIPCLIKYYQEFKKQKEEGKHKLRIAAIFSFQANEDEKANESIVNDDGFFDDEEKYVPHSREYLDECIEDYNKMFNSKYSSNDFKAYNDDVSERVKNREIDILIVVNMFLTGFDAKMLNTLYVDKNLQYHGLLQAFSRTNRILNAKKSHGNIICYRPLRQDVENAIKLFSNPDANKEKILMKKFDEYVKDFIKQLFKVKSIAPTADDVATLSSEKEKAAFVLEFRTLLRILNILDTFVEFDFDKINWNEEELNSYKSQYLDIKDASANSDKNKESILNDIDFEIKFLFNEIINVDYIMDLLSRIEDYSEDSKEKAIEKIHNKISSQENLRSKKDLIMDFISQFFAQKQHRNKDELRQDYSIFIKEQEDRELSEISKELGITTTELQNIMNDYTFKGRFDNDLIKKIIEPKKLGVTKRRGLIDKIINRVKYFINRFDNRE